MQRKGLSPDEVTFSCILKACGSMGAVDKGELVNDEIVRQGLLEGFSALLWWICMPNAMHFQKHKCLTKLPIAH